MHPYSQVFLLWFRDEAPLEKGGTDMGLLDIIFAGKRIEEIKMAYIGKHVFENLKDPNLKAEIVAFANRRLRKGLPPGAWDDGLENVDERVRYVFYTMAMAEMRIDHGVSGYQWCFVRNPFRVTIYGDNLWRAASNILKRKHHIEAQFPQQE